MLCDRNMAIGRTDSKTMVDSVRLFSTDDLPNGATEQQQCPHPHLFPGDISNLSDTLVYGMLSVLFPLWESHPVVCRRLISHSVSILSRQGRRWSDLLRIPVHRTDKSHLCTYSLFCTLPVDIDALLSAIVITAHLFRIPFGCHYPLLVRNLLVGLSRQSSSVCRPFRTIDKIPYTV